MDRLPITGVPVGGVSAAALVCGDPARATQIAGFLEAAELLSEEREYRTFQGNFRGLAVVVCSHGVGAPGAAIAFEELIRAGARRIVRVGTCGALQPDIESGELVIATAAMDHTGYGRETVPAGYPAVADLELTLALRQAADTVDRRCHSGLVLTRDSFYRGLDLAGKVDYRVLAAGRVLAVEMECAALFVVSALRGVRAAAILAVDGNVLVTGGESMETYRPRQPVVAEAVKVEVGLALEALYRTRHLEQPA